MEFCKPRVLRDITLGIFGAPMILECLCYEVMFGDNLVKVFSANYLQSVHTFSTFVVLLILSKIRKIGDCEKHDPEEGPSTRVVSKQSFKYR